MMIRGADEGTSRTTKGEVAQGKERRERNIEERGENRKMLSRNEEENKGDRKDGRYKKGNGN